MRIIGGQDIYDGPAAVWQDGLVWTRGNGRPDKGQEKVLKSVPLTSPRESYVPAGQRARLIRYSQINAGKDLYAIHFVILFLCGKIYRGVRLNSVQEELFFWTEEAFDSWLEEKGLVKDRPAAGERHYPFETTQLTPEQEQPFLDARIVIAWTTHQAYGARGIWQVNTDGLKHVAAGKLLTSEQIAQEIIRYVGSRMIEPDPAKIVISDEVRIAKHGMDKTSFRKAPGQKKRGAK